MKKALLILTVLAVGIGTLVYLLERPDQGVEPIVWDQSACAHCHMHIGNPYYAAQLQTREGRIHNFDDPGCLFAWLDQNDPSVRQIYFHHYRDDTWLPRDETRFVQVDEDTPMGYGIGAVRRSEDPNAMTFEEAQHAVLQGRLRPSRGAAGHQPRSHPPHQPQPGDHDAATDRSPEAP